MEISNEFNKQKEIELKGKNERMVLVLYTFNSTYHKQLIYFVKGTG